jgi:triosephosphate isomerase
MPKNRKPIIAGNWKMHRNHLEAIALVQKLHYLLRPQDYDKVEVVVCPPFTALRAVQTLLEGDRIPMGLGGQNCHWEKKGAFTGEISAAMLLETGCRAAIIGHSERRRLFGETDEALARKVPAALAAGLVPMLCVGETLEQREAGQTEDVLRRQVEADLAGVAGDELGRVVIAYEPVWAIGTGRNATPEQAAEAIAHIRSLVAVRSEPAAGAIRILYGGSVTPENAAEVLAPEGIDGALVGGASLEAADFAAIVGACR